MLTIARVAGRLGVLRGAGLAERDTAYAVFMVSTVSSTAPPH
ncbi:hypothetical protein [Kibdelosporangium phytohabitans]|nr:hypothetical protein [Kibdelosporangium phytohabitans]MBE1462993.1 hypothetical protein [Kibdelosporangium phytohabitans]